jgi:hypothetical protein
MPNVQGTSVSGSRFTWQSTGPFVALRDKVTRAQFTFFKEQSAPRLYRCYALWLAGRTAVREWIHGATEREEEQEAAPAHSNAARSDASL